MAHGRLPLPTPNSEDLAGRQWGAPGTNKRPNISFHANHKFANATQ